MNAIDLKEQLLRSEGYSIGFRDGYAACVKYVADKLATTPTENNNEQGKEHGTA